MNRLFLSLVLLAGCSGSSKDQSGNDYADLTNVRLINIDNHRIDLKQDAGKIVFINFWATWCGPCIKEMPAIERAQELLKNENVVFYLASSESLDEIRNFKKNHPSQLKYVQVENSEDLFVNVLPTTYIYDEKGKMVYSQIGMREWDMKNNLEIILHPDRNEK